MREQSHVIKHERCPRCAKQGRDRAGDNLAVYSDGHKFCFGCGWYYGHNLNSIDAMVKKLYKYKESPKDSYEFNLDNITYNIPKTPLTWVSKYGILPSELKAHRVYYDYSKECLFFPIYDGHDQLVSICGRYFGPNPEHPKYVIRGFKTGFFKVIKPLKASDVYVITEDWLSAIKVGRQYNAIPIMGTHIPNELILRLVSFHPKLRIWLDFNKAADAIRQAARIRQYIPNTGTIVTELDPKEYNDTQIREQIDATLSKLA